MTWRAARSLLVLHEQLKRGSRAAPPSTGIDEWGLVGDAAHDPTSDHTPHDFPGWGTQIVTAADFPNRPDLGLDAHRVLDDIRRARDPRAKYGISNAEIFSNHSVLQGGVWYDPWEWRPYRRSDGTRYADEHYTHGHLSVVGDARADGEQPWPTIGANVELPNTSSPDHSTNRNDVEGLADLVNLRLVLIGQKSLAQAGYGPGSPLAKLIALANAGPTPPAQVDVSALAAALQGPLSQALGAIVPHEAVVDALQSPEGQAALVRAANTAEDG